MSNMDMSNLCSNLPPAKPVTQAHINEVFHDLTTEFKNAAKSVASLYSNLVSNTSSKDKLKGEFANAAKSVASLYRLTHTSSSLLQHKGYLQCLDDLLNIIAQDGDVENWALTRRAEITYEKKYDLDSNDNESNDNDNEHENENDHEQEHEHEHEHEHEYEHEREILNNKNNNKANEAGINGPVLNEPNNLSTLEDANDFPFNIPSDFEFTFAHETKPYTCFKPSLPLLSVQHPQISLDRLKKVSHRNYLKKLQEDSSSDSDQDKDKDDLDYIAKKRKFEKNDNNF